MLNCRTRRAFALAAAISASALVTGVTAAGARDGGNSANAHLCQKGGWQNLTTSTGGSFGNQGECVSYAAQGGTLTPKPSPFERFFAICGSGRTMGQVSNGDWVCLGRDIGALEDIHLLLEAECTRAGGTTEYLPGGFGGTGMLTCSF